MSWINGLQKFGDVYHCRVRHKGREYNRSTGQRTLEGARRWLRQFRDALDDISSGNRAAPSVSTLVEIWDADHARIISEASRARTKRDFTRYLIPRFGDSPADQVTSAEISALRRDYLDAKGPHGKPHTIGGSNGLLRHFHLLWRYGVKEGLHKAMPWDVSHLRQQRKPKVTLPVESIPAFLKAIDQSRNSHVAIAVRFMLFLGLREHEALHLRWDLFSSDGSTYTPGCWLEGSEFKSKGGEAEPLPVPPALWEMLQDLRKQSGLVAPCPWVLPWRDDKKIMRPHAPQFTKKDLLRAGNAVGISSLSPHRLRGSCATLLARTGIDPFIIQRILRHKDIKTTLGYVEVGAGDMRRAQEKLFALMGEKMGDVAPNLAPKITRNNHIVEAGEIS